MSASSGSQRRSELLGRIQQNSDRHEAAEATDANRSAAADPDQQLLADLRFEALALRNAAADLREVVSEARKVTVDLMNGIQALLAERQKRADLA